MSLSKLIDKSDPIIITEMEGMCYREDSLEIGKRSGPELSDEAVVHELAHFIEMEDKRVGKPLWGMVFKQGDYTPYGYVNCEFSTIKHVEREARVWAIQYILQNELFDMKVTVEELASSSPYLPDVWFLIGDDAKVRKVVTGMIKTYLKQYTLEDIVNEYQHKIKLLKKFFRKNNRISA